MIHAALSDGPRLAPVLALFRQRGEAGATTLELHQANGSMASATDVAELRANGYTIDCQYEGRTSAGRKCYRYTLIERPMLVLELQDA
jgi:hypothetical protein